MCRHVSVRSCVGGCSCVKDSSACYALQPACEIWTCLPIRQSATLQVPQAPPAEKPGRRLPRLLSRLLVS